MIIQIIGWFCLVCASMMMFVSFHQETANTNTDGQFMIACSGFVMF